MIKKTVQIKLNGHTYFLVMISEFLRFLTDNILGAFEKDRTIKTWLN